MWACWFVRSRGGPFLFAQERVEKEEAGAGDDGAVGHIEVRPMISEDVNLNEVDDRAVSDAVVEVAKRATENQRQRPRCEREAVAEADHGDQNGGGSQRRKRDQAPADCVRGSGISEEREGRALIEPVR